MDLDRFVCAAEQIASAIDRGGDDVWHRTSVRTRHTLNQRFRATVAATTCSRGRAEMRHWQAIERITVSSDRGSEYLRVTFQCSYADGSTGQELLTFRHDEDGAWRLAGFALRLVTRPT